MQGCQHRRDVMQQDEGQPLPRLRVGPVARGRLAEGMVPEEVVLREALPARLPVGLEELEEGGAVAEGLGQLVQPVAVDLLVEGAQEGLDVWKGTVQMLKLNTNFNRMSIYLDCPSCSWFL